MNTKITLAISILMLLFGSNVFARHETSASGPDNKKEILLKKVIKDKRDKSGFPYVEAWIAAQNAIVEASELKETSLYILNVDGVIMYEGTHYFGMMPETFAIDIPLMPGKYYIVIDSPYLYAEGVFEIRK